MNNKSEHIENIIAKFRQFATCNKAGFIVQIQTAGIQNVLSK